MLGLCLGPRPTRLGIDDGVSAVEKVGFDRIPLGVYSCSWVNYKCESAAFGRHGLTAHGTVGQHWCKSPHRCSNRSRPSAARERAAGAPLCSNRTRGPSQRVPSTSRRLRTHALLHFMQHASLGRWQPAGTHGRLGSQAAGGCRREPHLRSRFSGVKLFSSTQSREQLSLRGLL